MKKKTKENIKEVLKAGWKILVILSYTMFYTLCLSGVMIALLLSIYVLVQEGRDITKIANGISKVGYFGLGYIAIIMIDKIMEVFKK